MIFRLSALLFLRSIRGVISSSLGFRELIGVVCSDTLAEASLWKRCLAALLLFPPVTFFVEVVFGVRSEFCALRVLGLVPVVEA